MTNTNKALSILAVLTLSACEIPQQGDANYQALNGQFQLSQVLDIDSISGAPCLKPANPLLCDTRDYAVNGQHGIYCAGIGNNFTRNQQNEIADEIAGELNSVNLSVWEDTTHSTTESGGADNGIYVGTGHNVDNFHNNRTESYGVVIDDSASATLDGQGPANITLGIFILYKGAAQHIQFCSN